ncbi:L-rhamnose mutarotase [Sphingomonas sp. MMS24-JH45]
MTTDVLLLDLHDDADRSRRMSAIDAPGPGWPEITAAIRRSGIEEMRIYRLGVRLVMVMRVADTFDFDRKAEADAGDPIVQRWEALMARYQAIDPDGGAANGSEPNEFFTCPA